jgi:hypothetical protein
MSIGKVLGCTLAVLAVAGHVHSDSVFDLEGMGRDIIPATGMTRALGGAVVAAKDPLSVSIISPFGSAVADRLTITGGFTHISTKSEILDETKRNTTTYFPSIGVTVPLKGFSLLTGLFLEKAGRLTLVETDSIYELEIYDAEFRRETSINSVPILVSREMHPRLVVSAGVVLSFFDTRERTVIDFRDQSRYDTDDVYDMYAMGEAFAAGFLLDLDRIRIGGIVRSGADLTGDLEGENRFSGIHTSEDISISTPSTLCLGIQGRPVEQVLVEVDYHQSPWAEAEIGGRPLTAGSADRWAVGIQYRGRWFWNASRYPLLAGYYSQPLDAKGAFTPAADAEDEIIEEFLSVGTSIPVAGDRGAVTLAFEIGRREAGAGSTMHETIYGFSLSVTALEVWRRAIRR